MKKLLFLTLLTSFKVFFIVKKYVNSFSILYIGNTIITISIFLFFLTLSLDAQSYSNIRWHLENPFKFFKEKNIYWDMKKIYDEANITKYENSKGLAFERGLQEKWKEKNFLTLGWAAYFGKVGYKNTCWNQNKMTYERDGECKNYINPKSHNIVVWLDGGKKHSKCTWSYIGLDNKQKYYISQCNKHIVLHDKPFTDKNKIYLSIDGNSKIDTGIKVKDILVVGLGDSYGSGEGNPDIPIRLDGNNLNQDILFVENRYFPRKKDNASAKWLDRRAHRSLYSYQFKTALQLALENPQQAITFVSFSSSGAVTDNIINMPKKAIEHLKWIADNQQSALDILDNKVSKSVDKCKYIRPQVELLKETLGDRKIDILLLSIGGNDIGFAKYVGNILFKKGLKKPTEKTKYELDAILFKNYYRLNSVLKRFMKDYNSSRIILTAYPKILYDENKMLCRADRREFIIPFGVTDKREQRLIDIEKYLVKPLYKIQKKIANEIGWNFVDAHQNKFLKHGFCAKKRTNIQNVQEQFVMPHKYNKNDDWIPFNPKEYRAYGLKQRWVQLPIDSILMINLTKKFLWFDIDFLFSDDTSGILHPTADGLAIEADENIKMIYRRFPELKERSKIW
jgi:hypothetical protein